MRRLSDLALSFIAGAISGAFFGAILFIGLMLVIGLGVLGLALVGISVEDRNVSGWLPGVLIGGASGLGALGLLDPIIERAERAWAAFRGRDT